MLGLAPRLPITITLLTAMITNLLVRLRPLPVHRAGRVALCFHHRENFFSARPLHLEQEGRAQISRCASGAGGRTCQSESDPKGWHGVLVWCPLPMLLLAHSERGTEHFFPRPLTRSGGRGKNVVDVGRGLESEMRSRDDLRRQASTLFPGQRRRSRRANQ